MLANGVKLTFKEGKEEKTRIVKLVDFEDVYSNDFLVTNQFTVEHLYENGQFRRPNIVVFINGIPISVFELKGFNTYETARDAFNDHKIKMNDISQLYVYCQTIVASDGNETKYGSPLSDWERFFVWEGIEDERDVEVFSVDERSFVYKYRGKTISSLEVLIRGLFKKEHIVDFLQDFVHYERQGESWIKKDCNVSSVLCS